MRNALRGKPAGMAGVALIALFALVLTPYLTAAAPAQGSVKVAVVVQGGSAHGSDFTLTLKRKGGLNSGSATGSGDVVTFIAEPGTYVITQKGPLRYKGTWSGDCNLKGEVVIIADAEAACTLTNVYGVKGGSTGGGSGGSSTPTPPRAPRTR